MLVCYSYAFHASNRPQSQPIVISFISVPAVQVEVGQQSIIQQIIYLYVSFFLIIQQKREAVISITIDVRGAVPCVPRAWTVDAATQEIMHARCIRNPRHQHLV